MITPTIRYRWIGTSISALEARKFGHLKSAQFKTLRLLHRTLKKNCPGRKSPWGWRPKKETHPNEPRMKDAVRSTTRGFGIIGGRVYIDTNICKHAIYYTKGRRGGTKIVPVKEGVKVLSIVKINRSVHFRKSSTLGAMKAHPQYLEKTARESEIAILKMYEDAVGVWISEA